MKSYPIVDMYVAGRKLAVSESTNALNREHLTRFLTELSAFPGVTISETDYSVSGINGIVIQSWYNTFIQTHKPATANLFVAEVNPFLRWLHAMGMLENDVSRILKAVHIPTLDELPEDERPMDKYLTHEQAKDLLTTVAGRNRVRDRAIIALILFSGLRTSELCSVRVKDYYQMSSGVFQCKRKGGKWCDVVVGDGAIPYLKAYADTRIKPDTNDDEPFFMTSHGHPCSRVQIYKALATKQESLGLATGGHALRHTFVSEIEKIGGSACARDCANHRSMVITNRYAHTTTEQRAAAVDALNWAG